MEVGSARLHELAMLLDSLPTLISLLELPLAGIRRSRSLASQPVNTARCWSVEPLLVGLSEIGQSVTMFCG